MRSFVPPQGHDFPLSTKILFSIATNSSYEEFAVIFDYPRHARNETEHLYRLFKHVDCDFIKKNEETLWVSLNGKDESVKKFHAHSASGPIRGMWGDCILFPSVIRDDASIIKIVIGYVIEAVNVTDVFPFALEVMQNVSSWYCASKNGLSNPVQKRETISAKEE